MWSCCVVLLACFLPCFLTINAQPSPQPQPQPQLNNITEILESHSDYSSFSQALRQTQLDVAINKRSAITVLVLDNTKMSAFLGQPMDTLRKILSMHVLLQWHTEPELKSSPNKTTSIPTLWQSSTFAKNNEGFVNVTEQDDDIMLGNGSPGSKSDIIIVKSIYQKDFNISVLEISDPIVPGGGPSPSPTNAPAMAPSPSRAWGPAPAKSPAGSPAMAPDGHIADISPSDHNNNGALFVGIDGCVTMLLITLSLAWVVAKII